MTHAIEPINVPQSPGGNAECILCHKNHKSEEEQKLSNIKFSRNDDLLTEKGRTFIKTDPLRRLVYPKDEQGNFVSPLEKPAWPEDHIFNTYKKKYQKPPILGYIAAPHHMIAICCINGEKGLPSVPRINPWASKAGYDINNGGNCIFLPSSASQFYVAYYYWKVRGTGQALQGHLGGHRKEYFEEVHKRLEMIADNIHKAGFCANTSTEENKQKLAERILGKLQALERFVFGKLAALKPEETYRLGAKSYIDIPDESQPFHVPAGVIENLRPYETLPQW